MNEFAIISILPGILLIVLTIMAEAYWQEARFFYYRAIDASIKNNERIESVENYDKAYFIFRIILFGMLICLLSIIMPIFIPSAFSTVFAKYLLGIVSFFLVIFLVCQIFGFPYIKYLRPKELLEKIEKS